MVKKKIFIYAYEGTGLGHLTSLIKVCSGLYHIYNCVIVSGHTALPEIIPENMNFYLIPSFTEELKKGKTETQVMENRITLIWNLVNLFKPDAFITDFLPLWKRFELYPVIAKYPCKKYFTLRSEIGGDEVMYRDVFSHCNNFYFEKFYDRIFLMSDNNLTDSDIFAKLSPMIQNKIEYVGLVVYPISIEKVTEVRKVWLRDINKKWIVCSAGGGRKGEQLIKECIRLSMDNECRDYQFDIVPGYYSGLVNRYSTNPKGNVRITNSIKNLYFLHASADIVICTGAYNSLTESIQGRVKSILAMSVLNEDEDNEQIQNILKLQRFYNIYNIPNIDSLKRLMTQAMNHPPNIDRKLMINMNGIQNIRNIIEADLK